MGMADIQIRQLVFETQQFQIFPLNHYNIVTRKLLLLTALIDVVCQHYI